MTGETKQAVKAWSAEKLSVEGLLAAGGGFPDGDVFTTFIAPEFVLAHNEEVWRAIGTALTKARDSGAACDELRWSFEGASLLTACRKDGTWLGVFLPLESASDSAGTVRARLGEFTSFVFPA